MDMSGDENRSDKDTSDLQNLDSEEDGDGEDKNEEFEEQDASNNVNLMDFSDTIAGFPNCIKMQFSRPILNTVREQVYESKTHTSQAMQEMYRFYVSGKLCDMVLKASDTEEHFPCHKLVLAASSTYFDRMFGGNMSESRAEEVHLKNISGVVLKRLINYAYTSRLIVDSEIALEMFEAADMFQFVEMRTFCQDFLLGEITTENCLSFLLYADTFSSMLLYQQALGIAAKEFEVVRLFPEYLDLPFDHVNKLLTIDTMEVEYEEYVFESFKTWISHDSKSRLAHLVDLFQSIRLNFVSRWYLIEIISKDVLISSSSDCLAIIQRAKDQLLAFGHTYETSWQLPTSRKRTGLTWKIVYVNTYDPQPGESEVFLFDPVNKSWSSTNRACPMASDLSSCCCVGDSFLIIGGWTNKTGTKSMNMRGPVNVIHEFKVMSIFPTLWYVGSFSMQTHRFLHASVVYGNRVFIVGGCDEAHSPQCTLFTIDVSNNYRFEIWPRMSYRLYRPACCIWKDKLFVFGGILPSGLPLQKVIYFDLLRLTWGEEHDLSIEAKFEHRSCHYAFAVAEFVYVLCGFTPEPYSGVHPTVHFPLALRRVDSILKICPNKITIIEAFPMEPRDGMFCATMMNEKIYITGGTKYRQYCNTIDCFNTLTSLWEVAGSSREGRGVLSLCTSMRVMHENFGF